MSTNFHFLIQAWRRARSYNLGTRVRLFVMILVFVIPLMGANHGVALAAGTTYYVDNTNPVCSDSGPGTMAAPLCTITRGDVLAALPGDTVHVLAGTYVETVIVTHSGAEGNPITFHASPGVTVTGNPGGFGSAFAVSSKSYVVIDGFNITETKFKGIYVDGSNHITITNNNVSYAGKDTGSDQHQQGIFLRNTTYSTISGNVTHHNSCIGIRLINNSDYNTVSNNISYANSSAIAHPVVVISDAAGIELTGSSNNTVSNNITYGNEDTGINLYVNSSGVGSSYNLVVGNLSYGNGDHGIDNNNSPYNTIIGNTVHGNGTVGINFEGTAGFGSHHATVMNNISTGNGFTPPAGSFGGNMRVDSVSIAGTILDYNLYNRESASVQIIWNNSNYVSLAALRVAEPSQEVHGLEGDPLFMQPVESVLRTSGVAYPASETTGNYHLSPGSPAIDSANSDAPGQQAVDIEGNARIDDPATTNSGAGARTYDDRGAYEYQPSGSNVAPVVTTQAATLITQTTALGNGTISSLGVPNPTQHGFVWSTSVNPTIADDKTTEGSVSETGAFTSAITGLMPGTLYHVRAYATNAAGTAYGADMTFTTLPATTVVFNTSGTWVAPAGVTSVTVEVWGGGGRGGSISSGSGEAQGGGGGGGAYSIKNNIPVTPGNSYSYVVGTGSTSTSAGGDSYFINISTVLARGGNSSNSNNGASGGAAASGVGDVKYSGGSGVSGSSFFNYGGGGGSSAGTAANGSTATNATGATAPSGGGNGGNGKSSPSGNGTAGSTPGGAGGGAYRSNGSNSYNGGAGANGQIRITYYVETRPTTTSVNCGAGTPAVTYGDSITCVATVSASSGTPTGTVSWSTGGAGSFVTSPCNLSSGSCSVSYTPSSVGSGSHLITANYTGGGAFLPSSSNQSVTVNPKALTINGVVAEDKTYDGTMTATLDLTSAALVGVVAPDIVAFDSSSVTSTFASANAGTWAVTASGFGLSGADISNYTLPAQPVIPDATILPKAASVTPNAAGKVYGEDDPALTGTLTGFLAGDNVTATYSRAAGETVAGGPYTISAVLAPAGVLGNYTITYNTAAFTITPKTLTITGVVANNKVYDGTTAATFNLTGAALVGVVAPDVVTINSGSAMGAFASANAGTWAVTASGFGLSGAGAGNYTLAAQPVLPNATITPKAISVTANAASKFYGAVDPVLTYTSTPLAGGDSFSGTLARAAGENVGIYAINQGTLTAGSNYIITFTGANLTVNPLAITVTADAGQMKAEGAADPAEYTYAVNPALVGSDTFSGALTRELGETPGFYAILVGTLSAGANYDMTFVSNNFEIVANQAPVITEGSDIGVTMSKNGFPDKFALTLNATDAEAHTLTWSIQTQAGNGTATATGDGNSKVIAYAPTLNFSGADSFVVRVTDQLGAFDDITVNVTVSAGGDFPTFVDVPMANSAWSYIESIYYAGITGGCSTNPLAYCPNSSVTRAQMAIFLLRGMYGQAYTPPPATGTVFADVPLTHSAAAWIEQLAAEGITGGCGNGNYCPSSPVTRAQMAIFLLRAKYGQAYTPPAATGTEFLDVPIGHSAAAWIEQLAAEGITGGCGGGNYCPNNSVTRAQMAIFIQRTFDLARP